MARKIALWAILAFLVAALGVVCVAQRNPDLPSGVPAEMWIPINASAGVALSYDGPRIPALTHGTLMIKSHGSWVKVYLDSMPEKQGFLPVIK